MVPALGIGGQKYILFYFLVNLLINQMAPFASPKLRAFPPLSTKLKQPWLIGKHIFPFSCYTHGHRQSTSTNALVIVGFLNGQDKNYGDAKLSTPISQGAIKDLCVALLVITCFVEMRWRTHVDESCIDKRCGS